MQKTLHKIFMIAAAIAALAAYAPRINALPAETYATQSRLSAGTWVKISVPETGLYRIPAATLRSWGFTDLTAVRVCGYGGARIPDALTASTYRDDLPPVTVNVSEAGIEFYAVANETLMDNSGYMHYRKSDYSDLGYYYVTQDAGTAIQEQASTATPGVTAGTGTPRALAQYEKDLFTATNVGPLMVGEDMRRQTTLTLTLATPRRVAGDVLHELQMFSRLPVPGKVSVQPSGGETQSLTLGVTAGTYAYGTLSVMRATMEQAAAETLPVTLTATLPSTALRCNLDYYSVLYPVDPALHAGQAPLDFFCSDGVALSGASAATVVWDVTDPYNPLKVNHSGGATASWTPDRRGTRRYVAWNSDAKIPAPTYVGPVSNQNLHAPLTTPEMVIFTSKTLSRAAERIAALHRQADGMEVDVVDVEQVYNEFSSGAPDIGGMRKYLKMVYDRGAAAGKPLRYCIVMGRPTLDHRGLTVTTASEYPKMPWWVVKTDRQSCNETDAFGTDDFLAMLEDGQGESLGIDVLSIAVGRIPAVNADEADKLVDKMHRYLEQSKKTGWKNKFLFVADDGDNGVHLNQTERMIANMRDVPGEQYLYNKVYLDSYSLVNGEYPQARRDQFRALDEGVAWWYFIGHATNHSWTGENQLNFTDINNMYLRNLPFVMASTCNFLQWDYHDMSGGEIMYKEEQGGCIGMVSATRPAYITDNGYLLAAWGRAATLRDEQGRVLTPGEVYRRAKNDIRDNRGQHVSNTNRLRFAFMGDPALRLATPDNIVEITAIDGRPFTIEDQLTIPAMANVTVSGRVTSPDGTPLTDFDGVVSLELFDAEKSLVTNGRLDDAIIPFDTDGDKLFAGSAPVRGGQFEIKIAMPSVVSDNFRPAAMSAYAYATNSNAEAIGVNREFYVYGYREPEKPDTEKPVIDSFVLNHSGFKPGDTVNDAPMVIAHVSDNVGINLSTAGIGQAMTLTLDALTTINDLSLYYTPDPDGTPGGTINYPLSGLADGAHNLRLRVFDTSGNFAAQEIAFDVRHDLNASIFDVYTDCNPASDHASFYIRHDRPGLVSTVAITVYDLMGRPVWTGSQRGASDMDLSAPVTWDLTDNAGRRVQRGIYLYRASITVDGTNYETVSRRIAVTAP